VTEEWKEAGVASIAMAARRRRSTTPDRTPRGVDRAAPSG